MKVCLLTHGYPRFPDDTTAPFIESIAETLQQQEDIDVTVLTPDTPQFARSETDSTVNLQTYRYFFPRQLQRLGYSNTLVNDCALKKYVYLLAPFLFISGIFHLFWLSRKHKFDVIHAHWLLPNGFISAVVNRLLKIPYVITLHGSDIFVSKQNLIFKNMAKWTLKHAAMVTSVTPAFLPELAALGVPEQKRCMIPNGVTPSVFSSPSKQRIIELRETLSIPDNCTVVFALGRIVLKKGFNVLIQALPYVREKIQDVRVIIGGDGTDLPRLKTLAEEIGVSDIVHFTGTINRTDVPVYFYLSDLFVLPAVFDPKGNVDGCPIVILEAMACGKPVVSSNISGIPIVVKDGETGILVDEKNVNSLATAIISLLENPTKREQFGRAAQQRIQQELTWTKTVEQFISIYQQNVNKNP
ncbi:glycosyltransferase family 4 protein [Candidatus Poribacteria bacterium]|nr:glycosyltransferase family 4 protein [Candidatus Poribacteria bacterium]MYB66096.1 glycosyltransferase family 4 protein [Candidatus Poribacteria bacterium]MYF55012.1 glycosyltransferase family 4 protein [Candidatus Poribacteria bacterium]MYI94954.1 glycosyltransferase family 4 protein [Candidatus Poribacteria bacterium]